MISFSQTVRDRAGNVIADASVTVYVTGTQNKASLFADSGGAESLPNPLTSSANGRVAFYVAPGTFDFAIVKGNFSNALSGIQIDTLLASELSANTGAAMVGTDDGSNLQVRIDGIESVIGDLETGTQPLDPTLTALAAVTTAADKLIYATDADAFATTDLTAAARGLLDDASASDMRTTLGLEIGADVQAQDAELQAIAGLTSAADRVPYFTGSGTAAVATFTGAARNLVDDASASDMRTTLGLAIGTDVQAYDAELAAIAGLTSAADRLPYFTGSGAAALATFTTAGRNLVDDTSAADQRTTLGATTVGGNLFTLTNPSAITFPKINADNTVTAESAATHRASIGATTAGGNLFTVTNPSAVTFPRVNADNTVTMRTAAELASDIGSGSAWITVKKTTDESRTSNNTLTADSTLLFAMAANTKYAIRLSVKMQSAATPGFQWSLAGPASPTLVYGMFSLGYSDEFTRGYSSYPSVSGLSLTGTAVGMCIELTVHNGANAGNFTFNWAQNTSNGTATIVLAGSYLEYTTI